MALAFIWLAPSKFWLVHRNKRDTSIYSKRSVHITYSLLDCWIARLLDWLHCYSELIPQFYSMLSRWSYYFIHQLTNSYPDPMQFFIYNQIISICQNLLQWSCEPYEPISGSIKDKIGSVLNSLSLSFLQYFSVSPLQHRIPWLLICQDIRCLCYIQYGNKRLYEQYAKIVERKLHALIIGWNMPVTDLCFADLLLVWAGGILVAFHFFEHFCSECCWCRCWWLTSALSFYT